MKKTELRKIASRYFSDYPIFINIEALHALLEACRVDMIQLHEIFRSLKYNMNFFETKAATQYGLLNLVMYALDALYVDELLWSNKRKELTREYKELLEKQQVYFNETSLN